MKTGEERFSFSWERDAMRGDAMPEGLPLYDQAAYQAMRYLYIDQIADLKAEVQRLENKVRVYHEALNTMGRETGWAKRKIDGLLGKAKEDNP